MGLWLLVLLAATPGARAHERYWLRCEGVMPEPMLIAVDTAPRAYQHGQIRTSEKWTLDAFEQVNTRISGSSSAPLRQLSYNKHWFEPLVPDWQTTHLTLQRPDFYATLKIYARDDGLRMVRSGPCQIVSAAKAKR